MKYPRFIFVGFRLESKVEQTITMSWLFHPLSTIFFDALWLCLRFKCCDYVVHCQFPCWMQRFPWPTILIATFLLIILGSVPFLRCTSMSIKQSSIVAMACGSGVRHWKMCLLHFFCLFYCTSWYLPPPLFYVWLLRSNICVHVFGFLLKVIISKM